MHAEISWIGFSEKNFYFKGNGFSPWSEAHQEIFTEMVCFKHWIDFTAVIKSNFFGGAWLPALFSGKEKTEPHNIGDTGLLEEKKRKRSKWKINQVSFEETAGFEFSEKKAEQVFFQ